MRKVWHIYQVITLLGPYPAGVLAWLLCRQVALADRILINKVDLGSEAGVTHLTGLIRCGAFTSHSQPPPSLTPPYTPGA